MTRRSQNKVGKRVFLDGKIFCLIVLWVVGLFIFRFVGFPPGITEAAKATLEATKTGLPIP